MASDIFCATIASMATKKTNIEEILKEVTEKLLDLSSVKATVSINKETAKDGDIYHVVIESESESGLLIGAHGATLEAIQSFLGMALRTRTEEWHRIVVDISGWRAKHEEYLVSLAKQAADRAKMTGEPQYLYNLSSSQRRIIHTALSEMGGVESTSEGEGAERYMVVKKV